MKIFNSLSRKIEEFSPANPSAVKMYTCGPTVYSYPTIGNWRTYLLSDLMFRALSLNGFKVDFVMNLTDVGHLTGDNLGDADTGEDRLEKAAAKEQKTAWEIAKFYGDNFIEGYKKLNLSEPMLFCKATEHIKEQIELVQKIEKSGFTYQISDGIYFDVADYEKAGNTYGELSDLEEIKAGARVEFNQEKRDARDFALWKFSPKDSKREMEWESPWGVGFPGWHIECSAMGMKYLGDQLDIHIGGEDLKGTHHPNEIVQSEVATGKKPFSKYWLHGAFLLVDGGRMGKSLGNAYTLQDIEEKKYPLLALRYYYMTTYYRKQMNFTWDGMEAATNAYLKLRKEFKALEYNVEDKEDIFQSGAELSIPATQKVAEFVAAVNDDLNTPEAIAIVWGVMKDKELKSWEKRKLIKGFDKILGLHLGEQQKEEQVSLPEEIQNLMDQREKFRKEKNWAESDAMRVKIEALGYKISDFADGVKVEKV